MIAVVSIAGGLLVQAFLYKCLFEDTSELLKELKNTLSLLPIAIVFESFTNWSPSFTNEGLKALLWLPSGLIAGHTIYEFCK